MRDRPESGSAAVEALGEALAVYRRVDGLVMELILGLRTLFPEARVIRLCNDVHDLGRDLASEEDAILTGLIMLLRNGCILRLVLNEEDQRMVHGECAFAGHDGGLDATWQTARVQTRSLSCPCCPMPFLLLLLHLFANNGRFGP